MQTSPSQKRASLASISTMSSTSSSSTRPTHTLQRHASSSSSSRSSRSSSPPPFRHPHHKVQLIPHAPTPTHHATPLTPTEAALVRASESKISEFDDLDLSSADFDFDDVFTFGGSAQSQRRLRQGIVEVSVGSRPQHHHRSHTQQRQHHQQQPAGRRDWGDFSFSHFGGKQLHHQQQQQQVKLKPGMAGMQRELGMEFLARQGLGLGVGQGIGAKYVRNRGEGMGFHRRR